MVQMRNRVLVAPNRRTHMLLIALSFLTAFFIALRQLLHLFSDFLAKLFEEAGLRPVTNDYVLRETVNKKEGLCVPRVFLQSKFTKPGQSQSHWWSVLTAIQTLVTSEPLGTFQMLLNVNRSRQWNFTAKLKSHLLTSQRRIFAARCHQCSRARPLQPEDSNFFS